MAVQGQPRQKVSENFTSTKKLSGTHPTTQDAAVGGARSKEGPGEKHKTLSEK
jgi:hypothetical protein